MFERKWLDRHSILTGLSFNHDSYTDRFRLQNDNIGPLSSDRVRETVGGAYAQYTLNIDSRLVAMAGVRYDYNSLYGSLFTPRIHMRYIAGPLNMHASAGRGYHSPHLLAEYSYLLASSRKIETTGKCRMERAWNMGAGATWDFKFSSRTWTLGAEYYYTAFGRQLTADINSDPHAILFNYNGRSRSNTLQVELTAEIIPNLTMTAAYRLTDVRVDYGHGFVAKPLNSRSKGLFTFNYAPMMGLWQFDATLTLNGGGRMPTPYTTADHTLSWNPRYKAFAQLNLQITRNFRHWAIYIGGENLTDCRQRNPIIGASDPWGPDFDSTMIYGPLHGAVIYAGFRYNITKFL